MCCTSVPVFTGCRQLKQTLTQVQENNEQQPRQQVAQVPKTAHSVSHYIAVFACLQVQLFWEYVPMQRKLMGLVTGSSCFSEILCLNTT